LQAMRPAIERRDATPPPDLTRYKLLEIERMGQLPDDQFEAVKLALRKLLK
jgi:hypothetical protein